MDLQTQRLLAAAGSASVEPTYLDDVFKNYLYNGTGSNQTFNNGIDLTKGGLVWLKCYDAGKDHSLTDTERGVNKQLATQNSGAETTAAGQVTAFNNNGFTIGDHGEINQNTREMASWTFRAQRKFFDIITYTGNGTSGRTVSHSLGSVPGCIIVKCTSVTKHWGVYHRSTGATKVLTLNQTDGADTNTAYWNDTEPTSSVFTVGNDNLTNEDGETYVAYLFAHEEAAFGTDSDQKIISCGSYAGTDSDNKITLPFEPQWILIKVYSRTEGWVMFDSMRGISADGDSFYLEANANSAQNTFTDYISVNPDGFTVNGSHNSINANGENYIYIAIAAENGNTMNPEKITAGTDVFAMATGAGSSTLNYTSNFPVDLAFSKRHSHDEAWYASVRLIQGKELRMDSTNAEGTWSYANFDRSNGWHSWSGHGSEYQSWMWKRYGGLDVVTLDHSGTSNTNRREKHNLGRAPDMIWLRKRSGTSGWRVYHSAQGREKVAYLEGTGAFGSVTNGWGTSDPTATDFGINETELLSSGTWVAYLFASYTGISALGGYTGNSGTKTITTNFAPRFVMIKNTASAAWSNWYVYDTHRGIPAGNDNYLMFNKSAAQEGGADIIDVSSTGFTINVDWASHNSSSYDYVYYAHS